MRFVSLVLLIFLSTTLSSTADDMEALTQRADELMENREFESAFDVFLGRAQAGHPEAQYRLGRLYDRAAAVVGDFDTEPLVSSYVAQGLFWQLTAGENAHQSARDQLLRFMLLLENPISTYPLEYRKHQYSSFVCDHNDADFLPKARFNLTSLFRSRREFAEYVWFKIDCEQNSGISKCARATFKGFAFDARARAVAHQLTYAWLYGSVTSWLWNIADLHNDKERDRYCLPFRYLSE